LSYRGQTALLKSEGSFGGKRSNGGSRRATRAGARVRVTGGQTALLKRGGSSRSAVTPVSHGDEGGSAGEGVTGGAFAR